MPGHFSSHGDSQLAPTENDRNCPGGHPRDGQADGRGSPTTERAPGSGLCAGSDNAAAPPATAAAPEVRVTSTRGTPGSPGVLAVPTQSTPSHSAAATNQVRKRSQVQIKNRAPHPSTISRAANDRDKALPPGLAPGAPTTTGPEKGPPMW